MFLARVVVVVFALFVGFANSARILAVLPVFIKSHAIFTHSIVRELAVRGHDVTIITPFEDVDPPPNYKQILADKKTCWDEGKVLFFVFVCFLDNLTISYGFYIAMNVALSWNLDILTYLCFLLYYT